MLQSIDAILAEHPFLKGLKPSHVDVLAGCASSAHFEAGAFIFRQGQEANAFYLLRDGKVAVDVFGARRHAVTIDTLGEGDVLGWSWLVPPFHWHFDAKVIEPTRAIALDGRCLRTHCDRDHELGYELMKRFAQVIEQRLDAARWQLLDALGGNP